MKALFRAWESHMSKRYRCAVLALIGTVTGLTTASFSWWSVAEQASDNTIETGALIIDGTELTGPYQLEIVEERVLLNGQTILELPPIQEEEPVDLQTRHGVIQHALDQYSIIRQDNSRAIAAQDTLAIIRQSTLVEHAAVMADDLIEIQFKNEVHPDMLELTTGQAAELSPAARQQILINQRQMIENFLRADSLVVLIDGIVLATEPGTADERLDAILQANPAELTAQELQGQYRRATGDALVARLLAERAVEAAAKAVQP